MNTKKPSSSDETNILKTMVKNFQQGYDNSPTKPQLQKFEEVSKNAIENDYKTTKKNREKEEIIFNLLSSDPEIAKAIQETKELHGEQTRKVDKTPYFEHPLAVAKIVSRVDKSVPLIQSALFHDVIEDVQGGREWLKKQYPGKVFDLVNAVSEQDKSLSRKERKKQYLKHLSKDSYDELVISLSDRIHNLRSMIESLEKHGSEIRKYFNAGIEDQKRFIASYASTAGDVIHSIQDEKQKTNLKNLYDELISLIRYFGSLTKK